MENGHLPPFYQQKMVDVSGVAKGNIKQAMQAGVKIAMGTDAAVYPHGLNAHELDVYVNQMGMTPLAALQTATINAADLMGWTAKTGSLEPGKWADIIAVEKNPLEDVQVARRCEVCDEGGRDLQRRSDEQAVIRAGAECGLPDARRQKVSRNG